MIFFDFLKGFDKSPWNGRPQMQDRIFTSFTWDHGPSVDPTIRYTDGRDRVAHQDPVGSKSGAPAPLNGDSCELGQVPKGEKDCPENRRDSEAGRSPGCGSKQGDLCGSTDWIKDLVLTLVRKREMIIFGSLLKWAIYFGAAGHKLSWD